MKIGNNKPGCCGFNRKEANVQRKHVIHIRKKQFKIAWYVRKRREESNKYKECR
jgi:hypothetical protein